MMTKMIINGDDEDHDGYYDNGVDDNDDHYDNDDVVWC